MLITKIIEIDLGHRVPSHKGKCKNFHGHRYRIEVGVDDKIITKSGSSSEGMVIDFGDLKEMMMQEIDAKFDHGFVMYNQDKYAEIFNEFKEEGQKIIFVDFIPTAENFAKHWFELIEPKLEERNIKLKYVKVWETPTSTAIYEK
jgi:6-pyruvoyltetrahydropterin/6-carboxytetrahydropterin synthase